MGMNAYGAMLTVLTGIDSFRPIKANRTRRIVTIVVLAIIWYAAGAAITMIPFMVLPPLFGLSYEGYVPAHLANGVDYSWLVGLVVSGLVYLVASRSLDLAPERAAIEASDRELQSISGSSTSA